MQYKQSVTLSLVCELCGSVAGKPGMARKANALCHEMRGEQHQNYREGQVSGVIFSAPLEAGGEEEGCLGMGTEMRG